MNKNNLIAKKKDIIIFFIISILCSIFFVIELGRDLLLVKEVIELILFSLYFHIPPVLVVILNLIFKIANIENEKIIKITKIIFYPIVFLLMFFEGVLIVFCVPK